MEGVDRANGSWLESGGDPKHAIAQRQQDHAPQGSRSHRLESRVGATNATDQLDDRNTARGPSRPAG